MKFEENVRDIRTNIQEKNSFSIDSNPAAFRILTSNLYKFPIRAIIRELSCNAIDANREYGEEEFNWTLHMPILSDSVFSIRDNGGGMDDESIMHLYTTFFRSTKSDSDSFTGMFGLGSKTPFAYTNQFTIESIHEGVKRIYSAFFDGNGIPSIAPVGEFPSCQEHSGIKVSFYVKPSDVELFHEELRYCVGGWRELPHMENVSQEDMLSLQGVAKAYRGCYVYKKDSVKPGGYSRDEYVEMGNVLYPIASYNIGEHVTSFLSSLREAWGRRKGRKDVHDIILHLPIGSISVTPSREEIHYTENTKKTLITKVTNFYLSEMYENFSSLPSFLQGDARFMYNLHEIYGYSHFDNIHYSDEYHWGRILPMDSEQYLSHENHHHYEEMCQRYFQAYQNFTSLPSKERLIIVKAGKSYFSEHGFSYGNKGILLERQEDDTICDALICTSCDDVFLVEMNDPIRNHIRYNKPVPQYLKRRMEAILKMSSSSSFPKYFIFIDSMDFEEYDKFFDRRASIFRNFDKLSLHASKKKKREGVCEKGKMDLYIPSPSSESSKDGMWKKNVDISMVKDIMESGGYSTVYVSSSRKVGEEYFFYLTTIEDILQKRVPLSFSRGGVEMEKIFNNEYISPSREKFLIVTSPPSRIKNIPLGELPSWKDPILYMMEIIKEKYEASYQYQMHFHSCFFEMLSQRNREKFLSYPWERDTPSLISLAMDTFSSYNEEFSSQSVYPPFPRFLEGNTSSPMVSSIHREITDIKHKIFIKMRDKEEYLDELFTEVASHCPLLSLMDSVRRDFFYERKFLPPMFNEENTCHFIEYMAHCYGMDKMKSNNEKESKED